MKSYLRLFIALELPNECVEFINNIQSQLQAISSDVKWVKPQNCHLTLKFLGDVPEETIAPIIPALEKSLENISSFSIETSGIGAFPSLQRPQILWLGADDHHNRLAQTANLIETTLLPFGIPNEDRTFSAHITLARFRASKKPRPLAGLVSSLTQKNLTIPVNQVILYRSILSAQGPDYSPIHRWSLQ